MKDRLSLKIVVSTLLGLVLGAFVLGGVYFFAQTFIGQYRYYDGIQTGVSLSNRDFQTLVQEGKIIIPQSEVVEPVKE